MSLPPDKRSIRSAMLRQRENLDSVEKDLSGSAAQSRLLELRSFTAVKTVALYSPTRNEVATDELLVAALDAGKQVCYPSVDGEDLTFYSVDSLDALRVGCFGICEPDRRAEEVGHEQIELLLIPGVAFDYSGFRIGYGRGYFDRMLSRGRFDGLSVGFCYDFQVLDRLPAEVHDQKVDLLVTDKRIISPS